jgi:exodeoxyribonuclease III
VRIATWNVNSLKARLPRVEEFLAYADVDVLCLQETKLSDAAFPSLTFQGLGYESAHFGQGQWNGVAILSRVGLADVVAGFDSRVVGTGPADDYVSGVLGEARLVSAHCGGLRIMSVYVPNGRTPDDPHYGAKLEWLTRLREHWDLTASSSEPCAVVGDFNIAPDDADVWDIRKFRESTHVTAPERERLAALHDWGFVDAMRTRYPRPEQRIYTYWDYRAGDFHQGRGMRIDLVLVSAALQSRVEWGVVDRQARKGKLPSDHAPVIVDLSI